LNKDKKIQKQSPSLTVHKG